MANQYYVRFGLTMSLICVLLLSVSPVHGQTITISPGEDEKLYELPHPGILPDNPFYLVKNIRDTIMRWSTQDLNEKAEIQLLQADKCMGMALELAKKGKPKMTVDTLIEGEEKLIEVPVMLEQVLENGAKPRRQFVDEAIQSSERHRAAIEEVLLSLPQGDDTNRISTALKLNNEAHKKLEKIRDSL